MHKLKDLWNIYWKQILISYGLFILNSGLFIAYPRILGQTIDQLVAKNYHHIWYLIATFVSIMILSYISKIYDIKIFSKIHRQFAGQEIRRQLQREVDESSINGRINMLNSVVHFFEIDIINIINTILGVVGSLYFLSLVSPSIVCLLSLTGTGILILSYYYSPKVAILTREQNDLSEIQTDVVKSRKFTDLHNFLRKIQKISLRRAKLDASFNITIQTIIYGSVTALITYYVMYHTVSIGSVFSTYRYMFDFCTSLISVPYIVTSYLQIQDVMRRLEN